MAPSAGSVINKAENVVRPRRQPPRRSARVTKMTASSTPSKPTNSNDLQKISTDNQTAAAINSNAGAVQYAQSRPRRQTILNQARLDEATPQHGSPTDAEDPAANLNLTFDISDRGGLYGKSQSDTALMSSITNQASENSDGRNQSPHEYKRLRQRNTMEKENVKAKVAARSRTNNNIRNGEAQKKNSSVQKGQHGSLASPQNHHGDYSRSSNSGVDENAQALNTHTSTITAPASSFSSNAESSALRQEQPLETAAKDQSQQRTKKRKAVEDHAHNHQENLPPQRLPRRRQQTRKLQEEQQDGSSVSAPAGGRKKRRRQRTSEDAEASEIQPSVNIMSEMTKDSGLGQKSRRETLLSQVDWAAVRERDEQDRERELNEEREARGRGSRQNKHRPPDVLEEENGTRVNDGPRLRLLNNELVLDETSQYIDEHAQALEVAEEGGDALNESNLTKRVNQATIKPKRRKPRPIVWDEDNTDKFYEGLRMFGIDLKMIASHFFDGLDRQHMKRKYAKEERVNPSKIQAALSGPRKSLGKDEMLAMTKYEYEDPKDIYARIEGKIKEFEEAQAEEDEEEVGDQNNRPTKRSKPRTSGRKEPATHDNETPAAEGNEHEIEARRIVEDATTSRKKPKRSTATRKKAQRHKTAGGGTEEVLGSVEDVQLQPK